MDLDVLEKNARALFAFKGELEEAMPEIRKAIADASALAADIASIKETMAPALEWIAEQQKAIAEAKAAEQQKADEGVKAQQLLDEAAKTAAETNIAPAVEEKPLAHLAEAESAIAEPAAEEVFGTAEGHVDTASETALG